VRSAWCYAPADPPDANTGPSGTGNASIVPIDTLRQVKVFARGGGSARFIIDISGYYL